MESGCCHHSRPDDRGRQPPAGGQYRLRTGIGMPKIIFRLNTGEEQVVEGKDGWSVMQIAMRNDISGIDADCGGSASCATCHVYVADAWVSRVTAPDSYEPDILAELPSRRPSSRLSCPIMITPQVDWLHC